MPAGGGARAAPRVRADARNQGIGRRGGPDTTLQVDGEARVSRSTADATQQERERTGRVARVLARGCFEAALAVVLAVAERDLAG
jgi:hypothetical protein